MIQISLRTALVLYTSVLGAMVLLIWIYTEVTVRRSHHHMAKQFLWRCVFCGYAYLDEAAEKVSRCPRCDSINSVEDKRARFVKERPTRKCPLDGEEAERVPARRNPSHRKRPGQKRRGPRRR